MNSIKNGTMNIGGTIYKTTEDEIEHTKLRFYDKNPRVYSELILNDGELPTQEEIEKHMVASDRAKELKEKIKANNGLINPIIVKDGDFSVLEGNTRLAAYRILSKSEPENETWRKMKCIILPSDIPDDAINILLGAYHIKGTKDWDPYEQAGYLYRWKETSKLPIPAMAKQLGLQNSVVENMIKVYSFMKEHDDLNKNNWSYYEEYLKNSGIKKIREEKPELDVVFVNQVISRRIPSAQFVRKIGEMGKKKDKETKKMINKISSGEVTIQEGYETLAESGKFDDGLKRLEKIRNSISTDTFEKLILDLEGDTKDEAIFIIKKINKRLKKILEKMNGSEDE